ncbi:MAG: hypothetical protein GF328_05995, partial [Candidatus Latescibacteria bacterium]|nr:hypothetical protein [Candidatus Latescibacterota bacterium]
GDPAGEVRGAAAFAITKSLDPGIRPTLKEAYYRDDHDLAKVGAVAGLARLPGGTGDAEFLASEGGPFLREAARSAEESVSRHYAVRVLSRLGPVEGRAETFREVGSGDPSSWVRRTALTALADTEGEAAIPFLMERMAEESSRNRTHVESLLKRLDHENDE